MTREEIVARAIREARERDYTVTPQTGIVTPTAAAIAVDLVIARAAIAAYESALRDEGYVIVKKDTES